MRAKAALARGDGNAAQRFAEAAVTAQNGLPYMEPPYWYVPVDQTLGAILLKKGDAPAAAAAGCRRCSGSRAAIPPPRAARTSASPSRRA